MNSDEKEILGDPEDADINTTDTPYEETNVKSPRAQDSKFLEMRFDQDVTIKLPQAPVGELVSSVGLMSAAVCLPESPSVTLVERKVENVKADDYSSAKLETNEEFPVAKNEDETTIKSTFIKAGENKYLRLKSEQDETDAGIALLPDSKTKTSDLEQDNLSHDLIANHALDAFVNSPEEDKCHDIVYEVTPNPFFDHGVKVLGIVNLNNGELLGVSPISNTKAWIYNCKRFNLVDLESGEVLNSYSAPTIIGLQLYGIDDNTVLVDTFSDRFLTRMTIEGDTVVEAQPFIKVNSKRNTDDDNGRRLIECYAVSTGGYVLACMFRQETCCCCFKRHMLVLSRFDNAGRFVRGKKVLRRGKSAFSHSVTAMKINRNGDICLLGSTGVHAHDVHLAVFNSDVRYRFCYPPVPKLNIEKCGMYDIATDTHCNILVGNYGYIDVLDSNGNLLITLKAEFGIHGSSRSLSVGPDGKAWVCTELGRVVIMEYATRPITENP